MSAEILAPAGDETSAYAALDAGADAVYLGLDRFSARESAENFDVAALSRVTRYAHLLGAKVYVALNTLVKDNEIEDFLSSVRAAWDGGADAILMQDLFLGGKIKSLYPEIVLHLSTQAGCCNVYGAKLAKEHGFSRVVLARETPLSDIKEISQVIETEAFVQGALCTCFSGQCYFSSFAGNNSGNRGRCKQPCRKQYRIDRKGYESFAYALSLSDLCVGERVKEFAEAGVSSFKIEGRMRRPAYCAAAVRYYRALIRGEDASAAFTALKRAYNRGDYTRGLAFGQGKDLLSRLVQGHIGEDVGEVSLLRGKYFCKSAYRAGRGDGFKILRGGKEVGGAVFADGAENGFFLASKDRLLMGDRVRLTTQVAEVPLPPVRREIQIFVRLVAGEKARVEGGGVCIEGEVLPAARSAPVTKEEIEACFLRTDGAPLRPVVHAETQDAFVQKSALNALRRAFYARLTEVLAPQREPLPVRHLRETPLPPLQKFLRACIGKSAETGEILIEKPSDYANLQGGENVFLYLPPLFTREDEALVVPQLHKFAGIFAEGYYGFLLAKEYGVSLFAGFGVPVCNRFAAEGAIAAGAKYFTLSKEISTAEQRALETEGAFALCGGAVKVMDLCYCPFERTCRDCDRREIYTLTDEAGRAFPLRRYQTAKGCRFEVYNCAPLFCEGAANALFDGSVTVSAPPTRGHSDRSML